MVTLGPDGALVVAGPPDRPLETRVVVPGAVVDPDQVVDTTGAGDTFTGALAAERSRGAALVAAVRWAVVAAGLSIRSEGARNGMPTRAVVDAAVRATSG